MSDRVSRWWQNAREEKKAYRVNTSHLPGFFCSIFLASFAGFVYVSNMAVDGTFVAHAALMVLSRRGIVCDTDPAVFTPVSFLAKI